MDDTDESSDDEPTTSKTPFKKRKIMDSKLDSANHSGSVCSSLGANKSGEITNNIVLKFSGELSERKVNFQGYVMKIKQIWDENVKETYSNYDTVPNDLTA